MINRLNLLSELLENLDINYQVSNTRYWSIPEGVHEILVSIEGILHLITIAVGNTTLTTVLSIHGKNQHGIESDTDSFYSFKIITFPFLGNFTNGVLK